MPRFALMIEYDGGPYAGWQRQDNAPTVQGAIEAALKKPAARILPFFPPDVPMPGFMRRPCAGILISIPA